MGSRNNVAVSYYGANVVATADLDRDGDLDYVIAGTTNGRVALGRSDGTGTNGTITLIDTNLPYVTQVDIADLDRDGDPDVVGVARPLSQIVWWSNGGGPATNWTRFTVATNVLGPRDVTAADVDNDGDADLVFAAQSNNLVGWFENRNGLGTLWSQRVVQANISEPASVTVADMDRDGRLDVISSSTISNRVAWWRNVNGSGTVWVANLIATNPSVPVAHRVADMDRDGDPDLLVTYFSGNIRWWENNGTASAWTEHVVETNFSTPLDARVTDFDRDGDPDIVGVSYVDDLVVWWENRDGAADLWTRTTIETPVKGASMIRIGDLNGDGDNDVVGAEAETGDILLWPNLTPSNRTFFGSSNLVAAFAGTARDGCFGDFNGDGRVDAASSTTNIIRWWVGSGGATPTWTPAILSATNGADFIEPVDLDRDGDLDLVGLNYNELNLRWWENRNTNGSLWVARTIYQGGASAEGPTAFAVGDVDRDGDLDVAATIKSGAVRWYQNGGGATNWTTNIVETAFEDGATICLADLDGDGDLDIGCGAEIGAGSTNHVAWFRNITNGTAWQEITVAVTGGANSRIIAADVDHDGDLDLAGANNGFLGALSWWENLGGTGTAWSAHLIETSFGAGTDVSAFDADYDGDTDLLLADQGLLTYYENPGLNTNMVRRDIVAVIPGNLGIAADTADVDRDGLTDVLWLQSDGATSYLHWHQNRPHGDIRVTKTTFIEPAYRGRPLWYALVVTNRTPNYVRNVVVTDALPAQVTWLSDTSGGPPPVSNLFVWSLGDFPGHARTSVNIQVLIDFDFIGIITNRVGYSATITDTNLPSDNIGVVTTTVEYAERVLVSTNFAANAIDVADLDRDGDPDIAAARSGANPGVMWFKNNAPDGEAWLPLTVNNASPNDDIRIGDLNRDGYPDVVVCDSTADSVSWFANDGTGGTWAASTITGMDQARSVDIADLDTDGDEDLLVATSVHGFVALLNTSGTGSTWLKKFLDNTLNGERSIRAADFDLDGDMDFVGGASSAPNFGGLKWFENLDGSGTNWAGHTLLTSGVFAVHAADVDRDGDPDIISGDFRTSGTHTNVWWENRRLGGTNWIRRELNRGFVTDELFAGDVDRDADMDVLLATSTGLKIMGNANGLGTSWTTNINSTDVDTTAITMGDINRDGAPDLVAGALNELSWWYMPQTSCPTNFPIRQSVDTNAPGAVALATGDVDRDGDLDLFGALLTGDQMVWWRNISNATTWTESVVESNFNGPLGAVTADLDGDGDLDLVAPSFTNNAILWWANNGATSWTVRTVASNFTDAAAVDAADFDLDGDLDLVGVRPINVNAVQWFSNLNGTATAWSTNDMPGTLLLPLSVHAARVNPDARPDVIVGCAGGLLLYENFGNTNFVRTVVDDLLSDVVDVDSADLDRDGDVDLLGATEDGNRLYWWMNSNGLASTWVRYPINVDAEGATGIRPVDLDCDGDLDVIATLQDTNRVIWMENMGGASNWALHVVQEGFSLAVAPMAGDFNRDGEPDIAAAARGGDLVSWWPQLPGGPDTDGDGLPDLSDLDDDNDGMPDVFEELHGFNPLDPSDAGEDEDDDSILNLFEYIADTIPTNGSSFLHVRAISNGPPVGVLFSGSAARIYTLQFNTNLVNGVWSNLTGRVDIPGLGAFQSLTDSNASPAQNYRLQVELP